MTMYPKYDNKTKLYYTDIDSFILDVQSEDIYA